MYFCVWCATNSLQELNERGNRINTWPTLSFVTCISCNVMYNVTLDTLSLSLSSNLQKCKKCSIWGSGLQLFKGGGVTDVGSLEKCTPEFSGDETASYKSRTVCMGRPVNTGITITGQGASSQHTWEWEWDWVWPSRDSHTVTRASISTPRPSVVFACGTPQHLGNVPNFTDTLCPLCPGVSCAAQTFDFEGEQNWTREVVWLVKWVWDDTIRYYDNQRR